MTEEPIKELRDTLDLAVEHLNYIQALFFAVNRVLDTGKDIPPYVEQAKLLSRLGRFHSIMWRDLFYSDREKIKTLH